MNGEDIVLLSFFSWAKFNILIIKFKIDYEWFLFMRYVKYIGMINDWS